MTNTKKLPIALALTAMLLACIALPVIAEATNNTRPTTPARIRVRRDSSTSLRIWWTQSPRAHGYELFRRGPGERNFRRIATLTGRTTSFHIDENLRTNRTYRYKVRAFRNDGNRRLRSPFTYQVSARPFARDARIRNANRIQGLPNRITIGIREEVRLRGRAVNTNRGANPLNTRVRYLANNSRIRIRNTDRVVGVREGTSSIFARRHDGRGVRILVTVRNFATPARFDTRGVNTNVAKLLTDYHSDITYIANYFLHNPGAGTGRITLGPSGTISNPNNIRLGSAEAAISRLVNSVPYWVTIVVRQGAVTFELRYTQNAFNHWMIHLSYFEDFTQEDQLRLPHVIRIAPRWTLVFAAKGASPIIMD